MGRCSHYRILIRERQEDQSEKRQWNEGVGEGAGREERGRRYVAEDRIRNVGNGFFPGASGRDTALPTL